MKYRKTKFPHDKEILRLGWALARARVLYYYYPEYVEWSDHKYDILEAKYLKLCKDAGVRPSANIAGRPQPDREDPSVKLIEDVIQLDIDLGILGNVKPPKVYQNTFKFSEPEPRANWKLVIKRK